MRNFKGSRLKIKRAEKHIQDLHTLLDTFPSSPDFHSVFIDRVNPQWGLNDLVITIHKSGEDFIDEVALIVGDTVHNLRSSLDVLYYEIVEIHNKWTRFPIRDTREELVPILKTALEQKQITKTIHDFILDTIKPYKTGNPLLWALHDMNIIDKHQLLISAFQIMGFSGISLKNDEGVTLEHPGIFTDASCNIRLDSDIYGWNPTLNDKGCAEIGIGFQLGTLFEGQAVLPALHTVAKEVTRTVEAFEILVGGTSSPTTPQFRSATPRF
jgi:hypothetical protein